MAAEPMEDSCDLQFPDAPSLEFGYAIIENVLSKGYCTIAMPELGIEERLRASREAQQMPRHHRMKQEIETAYMGLDCNTKIALRKHDTPKVKVVDILSRCDRHLTYVGLSLNGIPQKDIGFTCKSRTNAFVRTSYASVFEESTLVPESIRDIEEEQAWLGDVTSFVKFTQGRTLSMLYMIENDGGNVWLYPKDSNMSWSVNIPVAPGKLLIFRHDLAEYSYQPMGESAALQAWIMRDKNDMKHIESVDLDLEQRIAIVNPGRVEPTGPSASVKSLHVKMPGEVEGEIHWWNFFAAGTDGVSQWPEARWPTEPYYLEGDEATSRGLSYTKHGGFTSTEQAISFDNDFFGIDFRTAKIMILGQRWVTEVGYEALRKAGFSKQTLQGQPIGTWIGDVGPDWHTFQIEWARFHPEAEGHEVTTAVHSHITASRLAFLYGMTGPTSTYDTACSSSLVAMNAAHKFMFASDPPGQDHHMALVMGVNTLLGPTSYINNCAGGMLTHVGRCFTFNRAADGYQRGEGCGAIFLDSYLGKEEMAERKGSIIGSATNQDGRSASITAPNGPAQTEVIKKSMTFAGIDVNTVAMAECHGTGTALGDPIEVGALQAVMRKRTIPMLKVSTKTHIGHLEAGAGIAGLTKCVQMIRASTAPGNCHLNLLNPHINIDGYPVAICTEISDTGFSSGYCGVSSFGFGGTNSRCDVYGEGDLGPRKKIHVALPPPSFPRHIFEHDDEVNFVGSSMGWSNPIPYESTENGVYVFNLTLGQTCVEEFRLRLGGDESKSIYPALYKGDTSVQVLGPDPLHNNRCWRIDGREEGMLPGTVYQVIFSCVGGVKQIAWEALESSEKPSAELETHAYYCIGTFNMWSMMPMRPVAGADNAVACAFSMGPNSAEEFQIVRDRDLNQVFYPGVGNSVCGPDAMEHGIQKGSKFLVRGRHLEKVKVQFSFEKGSFTLAATCDSSSTTWGSPADFALTDSQRYYIFGSFDSYSGFKLMENVEGLHRATVTVGELREERFQIVLNQDLDKRLHPSHRGALMGPDSVDDQLSWVISGDVGSSWEIVLNLSACDRRNMLSFSQLDTLSELLSGV